MVRISRTLLLLNDLLIGSLEPTIELLVLIESDGNFLGTQRSLCSLRPFLLDLSRLRLMIVLNSFSAIFGVFLLPHVDSEFLCGLFGSEGPDLASG